MCEHCVDGMRQWPMNGGKTFARGFCNCPDGIMRRYGIDRREARYTWKGYLEAGGNKAIMDKVWQWTQRDDGSWLVLIGPAGVGKTGLASLAYRTLANKAIADMWEAYERGPAEYECKGRELWLFHGEDKRPYLWRHIRQIMDETKADYDLRGREPLFVRLQSEVDLLAIDDIGAEKASEWSMGELRALIYRRHSNQLRTIITSNLAGKSLKTWLDDSYGRIIDRIMETSVVVEWPASASSLRVPMAA